MRALLLAALLLGAPAAADTLTLRWAARDGREAALVLGAVAALSLRDHLRSGGDWEDWARERGPALADPGADWAAIRQRGRDHRAEVRQEGGGNALLLIQEGEGAEAEVRQDGDDREVILQLGRRRDRPQP